jgi:hypothetical protein
MTQPPNKATVGRRGMLRAIGVGAVGAAATAATAPLAPARADSETDSEKRKARYTESEHVKAYYKVNRYPTKK